MEAEWVLLQPRQSWYYDYHVDPRLSLQDLGRYCGRRAADPVYRRQIASYLGYLATSLAVFPERRREAQEALLWAYRRRLGQEARKLAKERTRVVQPERVGRMRDDALEELRYRFLSALNDFDLYYLGPTPLVPLGTLDMAWEPLEEPNQELVSRYPERHLSVANLVERTFERVLREAWQEGQVQVRAQSLDEPVGEGEEPWEVGDSVRDARDFEEKLLDAIDAGEDVTEVAAAQLAPRTPSLVSGHIVQVVVAGKPVNCVDIRGVAQLLDCSVSTLRRHDREGRLKFLREGGRCYLPVSELPAARVVVRSTGEWAKLLGVCEQTVRNWIKELPPNPDPLQLEHHLHARAGRKGKHRVRWSPPNEAGQGNGHDQVERPGTSSD